MYTTDVWLSLRLLRRPEIISQIDSNPFQCFTQIGENSFFHQLPVDPII